MAKVAVVLAVALACLIASAAAGNLISNAFGDNMVLAGGQNTQIWGWTMQDSNIVKLQMTSDQNVTKTYVTTSSNFKWIMTLNEPSGFTTWKIVVTTVFQAATIKNVVFGTVYICGGQSNMQMAVSGAFNSSTEVPQGDFYPFIRLFTAGQGTNSSVVRSELFDLPDLTFFAHILVLFEEKHIPNHVFVHSYSAFGRIPHHRTALDRFFVEGNRRR